MCHWHMQLLFFCSFVCLFNKGFLYQNFDVSIRLNLIPQEQSGYKIQMVRNKCHFHLYQYKFTVAR